MLVTFGTTKCALFVVVVFGINNHAATGARKVWKAHPSMLRVEWKAHWIFFDAELGPKNVRRVEDNYELCAVQQDTYKAAHLEHE
jgi:hypothetical protein